MKRLVLGVMFSLPLALLSPMMAFASEANLKIPSLSQGQNHLLLTGIAVCILGMLFGLYQFTKVRKFPAHQSMLDVSDTIYETCKTYLIQQGKLLLVLFAFIAVCIAFYFGFLQQTPVGGVLLILGWTVIGILGSYSVAWYGIRMNTLCQQPDGIFRSREKTPQGLKYRPRCRNQHRSALSLRRADHDADHPAVCSPGTGRSKLHRLCHR